MNRYDGEHFKQWPFPLTEEEIGTDGYLKSLTPVEELAVFLSLRGHCLREAGKAQEAASSYAEAARLVPASRAYRVLLADTLAGSRAPFSTNSSHQTPSCGPSLSPGLLVPSPPSSPSPGRNPLLNAP